MKFLLLQFCVGAKNLTQSFALFERQGADGTDLHAFSALIADCLGKGFVFKGGDHSLETPSGEANGSDAQVLPAYPYASAAENTLIGIVDKDRAAFIDGELSLKLSQSLGLQFYTQMFGDSLEFT